MNDWRYNLDHRRWNTTAIVPGLVRLTMMSLAPGLVPSANLLTIRRASTREGEIASRLVLRKWSSQIRVGGKVRARAFQGRRRHLRFRNPAFGAEEEEGIIEDEEITLSTWTMKGV
jgi:hypothetical protein